MAMMLSISLRFKVELRIWLFKFKKISMNSCYWINRKEQYISTIQYFKTIRSNLPKTKHILLNLMSSKSQAYLIYLFMSANKGSLNGEDVLILVMKNLSRLQLNSLKIKRMISPKTRLSILLEWWKKISDRAWAWKNQF